jgi:hypothetical protein
MALWNRKKKERDPDKPRRLAQLKQAYDMTRKVDRWVTWLTLAAVLVTFAVVFGLGQLSGFTIEATIIAIPLAILAGLVVFSRRVQAAGYAQVEGQPGAAAAVLDQLRRGWTITPAVQFNKNQDLVHRAVGRPGVVIIGEGSPARLRALMTAERNFVQRVFRDVPIHEIVVGDGEGQTPLPKLQRKVTKLPKAIKPAMVTEVNMRLRALGDAKTRMPIPKGPMPKGARMQRPR